jgi:hypothetical protein
MSSNCPTAPSADPSLVVQTTEIPKGKTLFRFHNSIHPAISFNPNFGKHIDVPEEGARFNPFPGAPASNIPTLYAADTLTAAALESVFHDVAHVPSPTYPKSRLREWGYSRLKTRRRLIVMKLVNPQLRQLIVPGRGSSITESELVHTLSSEYPHTRTWAQFLHDSTPGIDGLAWRPRLGGTGISYVLFGDRCDGQLEIQGAPISADSAAGLGKIRSIAKWANISIVDP